MPHAQYGIKVETSGNAEEGKTARELLEQARLAVPNSNSPNPVPHVRRGVEVEASKIKGRVFPKSSSSDPMPHDRFGVEDLGAEVFELRTARWLREQAQRVVPYSSSPDPVPHDLVGVEIEAPVMRTAREPRRVVSNSSCPGLVPHPA